MQHTLIVNPLALRFSELFEGGPGFLAQEESSTFSVDPGRLFARMAARCIALLNMHYLPTAGMPPTISSSSLIKMVSWVCCFPHKEGNTQ